MLRAGCFALSLVSIAASPVNAADMQPFAMDHRNGAASVIDLSFLLSAPAGKVASCARKAATW